MNIPLHAPNIRTEEGTKSGLFCFLDQTRPCDVTCMAFCEPPEQPDYEGKQWARCHLLVNAHRGGKHLVVLASHGAELVKKAKIQAADEARRNQPGPPEPR
jgi:hypothetical protein